VGVDHVEAGYVDGSERSPDGEDAPSTTLSLERHLHAAVIPVDRRLVNLKDGDLMTTAHESTCQQVDLIADATGPLRGRQRRLEHGHLHGR
jgi:hypothetical protein